VTLLEFADLQCPFCAERDLEVLPAVLERVRGGEVHIVLRPLRFLGPDSVKAAALPERPRSRAVCGRWPATSASSRASRCAARQACSGAFLAFVGVGFSGYLTWAEAVRIEASASGAS